MQLSSGYERELDRIVDQLFEEASKHWTWKEFAKEAGLSYSTVYKLGTRQTRLPQLRTVFKMADTLGWRINFGKRRLMKRVA